jgi:hypothetical protein
VATPSARSGTHGALDWLEEPGDRVVIQIGAFEIRAGGQTAMRSPPLRDDRRRCGSVSDGDRAT